MEPLRRAQLLHGERSVCYHTSVEVADSLPLLADVQRAAELLAGKVVRTPAIHHPVLDAIAGCELWLKAENLQHIGAFKARGALNAVSRLSAEQRAHGLITYSSGNHAQAVALAAQRFAVAADIAMPVDAPAVKVEAVKAMGARVHFAGTTSADRWARAKELEKETGGVIIAPFDDPNIIAGQGTATLELMQDVLAATGEPLDALLVPVGGGGLIAGACLVAAEHGTEVFSVEPRNCNALQQSLAAGELVDVQPGPTIADGLKPVRIGRRNFAIAQRHVAGSLLVDDPAIGRALVTLLLRAKLLVEPSGAAALAVALGRGLPQEYRRVGVMLSGGNVSPEVVRGLLDEHQPLSAE
jgi:threonine dehydratase